MPPIDKNRRTDPMSLKRRDVTSPVKPATVQQVESALPVSGAATVETDKAIGKDDGGVAHKSQGVGAKNAVHGMGIFGSMTRSMKRGVLVALMGLTIATGVAAPTSQHPTMPGKPLDTAVVRVVTPKEVGYAESIDRQITHNLAGAPPSFTLGRDAAISLIDSAGTPVDVSMPHADLPSSLLWNHGDIRIEHGTDPGDYYCEHALFTQQRFAAEVGIVKNVQGEPLVGFLHIPDDADASKPADAVINDAVRYAAHRRVVGAAFRGFFTDAKFTVHTGPVKILITGYGPFMSTSNNPSGGFVSNRDNIDAAMRAGFGSVLVSGTGELVADRAGGKDTDTMTLKYQVKDSGKVRDILIVAEKLDVNDAEFDQGDPTSLVGAMRSVRPHAMLSLGVHGGSQFLVEHHADDGGLVLEQNGSAMHKDSKPATVAFLDNYALARAVYRNAPHDTLVAIRPRTPGPNPDV